MTQEFIADRSPSVPPPTVWRENRGGFLSAFTLFVFFMGSGILVYRQNRFVPPRFPESNLIEPPSNEDELGLNEADAVLLRVVGSANDIGEVRIEIYDSESSFINPDQAVLVESVAIIDGAATLLVPVDTLPRQLAVAAYHDANSDGEMNRNRWGIPTERFGFTRNSRTGKPPGFRESVISRPRVGSTINVSIR